MAVEELLEIRFRPSGIEPVTWVGSSLASLLGNGLVVGSNLLEKSVTLAWLGNGNAMLVSKGLELRVGPATETLVCFQGPIHSK
jgi:hypothetical protein